VTATFKFAMIQRINVYGISFLKNKIAQNFLIRICTLKKSTAFASSSNAMFKHLKI